MADLEMVDRRVEKTRKAAKGDKAERANLEILEKLKTILEAGKMPLNTDFSEDEWQYVSGLQLISTKPVLYIANVAEDDLISDNDMVKALKEKVSGDNREVIKISAKIEEEIAELDDEEKALFLTDLGLEASGLDQVIRAGYKLLGLITFLTAGPEETRAWTIRKGTKAPQAAGKIHSDIERGFIRAEITTYEQLVKAGSDVRAKELGVTRIEGKDYVMQDGDVTFFRFNV